MPLHISPGIDRQLSAVKLSLDTKAMAAAPGQRRAGLRVTMVGVGTPCRSGYMKQSAEGVGNALAEGGLFWAAETLPGSLNVPRQPLGREAVHCMLAAQHSAKKHGHVSPVDAGEMMPVRFAETSVELTREQS